MRTRVFRRYCTVLIRGANRCVMAWRRGPVVREGNHLTSRFEERRSYTVSGRTAENSTIIISRGIIAAVGAGRQNPRRSMDHRWKRPNRLSRADRFVYRCGLGSAHLPLALRTPQIRRRDLHKRKLSRAVPRIGPELHLGATPPMK